MTPYDPNISTTWPSEGRDSVRACSLVCFPQTLTMGSAQVVDVGVVDARAQGSADKKRFGRKKVAVVMLIVCISAALAVGLSLGFALNRTPADQSTVVYLPENTTKSGVVKLLTHYEMPERFLFADAAATLRLEAASALQDSGSITAAEANASRPMVEVFFRVTARRTRRRLSEVDTTDTTALPCGHLSDSDTVVQVLLAMSGLDVNESTFIPIQAELATWLESVNSLEDGNGVVATQCGVPSATVATVESLLTAWTNDATPTTDASSDATPTTDASSDDASSDVVEAISGLLGTPEGSIGCPRMSVPSLSCGATEAATLAVRDEVQTHLSGMQLVLDCSAGVDRRSDPNWAVPLTSAVPDVEDADVACVHDGDPFGVKYLDLTRFVQAFFSFWERGQGQTAENRRSAIWNPALVQGISNMMVPDHCSTVQLAPVTSQSCSPVMTVERALFSQVHRNPAADPEVHMFDFGRIKATITIECPSGAAAPLQCTDSSGVAKPLRVAPLQMELEMAVSFPNINVFPSASKHSPLMMSCYAAMAVGTTLLSTLPSQLTDAWANYVLTDSAPGLGPYLHLSLHDVTVKAVKGDFSISSQASPATCFAGDSDMMSSAALKAGVDAFLEAAHMKWDTPLGRRRRRLADSKKLRSPPGLPPSPPARAPPPPRPLPPSLTPPQQRAAPPLPPSLPPSLDVTRMVHRRALGETSRYAPRECTSSKKCECGARECPWKDKYTVGASCRHCGGDEYPYACATDQFPKKCCTCRYNTGRQYCVQPPSTPPTCSPAATIGYDPNFVRTDEPYRGVDRSPPPPPPPSPSPPRDRGRQGLVTWPSAPWSPRGPPRPPSAPPAPWGCWTRGVYLGGGVTDTSQRYWSECSECPNFDIGQAYCTGLDGKSGAHTVKPSMVMVVGLCLLGIMHTQAV